MRPERLDMAQGGANELPGGSSLFGQGDTQDFANFNNDWDQELQNFEQLLGDTPAKDISSHSAGISLAMPHNSGSTSLSRHAIPEETAAKRE